MPENRFFQRAIRQLQPDLHRSNRILFPAYKKNKTRSTNNHPLPGTLDNYVIKLEKPEFQFDKWAGGRR